MTLQLSYSSFSAKLGVGDTLVTARISLFKKPKSRVKTLHLQFAALIIPARRRSRNVLYEI